MKKMKTGVLLLGMSLFMSCSTNEMMEPIEGNTPEIDPSQLNFKTIDLEFSTEKGTNTETRSAGDVDELGRPKGKYPLDNVFLFSVTENSDGKVINKVSKEMNITKSSKIAYAFVDEDGKENNINPTHVYITPATTKDNPSTGVMIRLSILKGKMNFQMGMDDIIAGDLFYYDSTDQKEQRLPKATNGNFCNELGDVLFRSAQYYLVFDKTEKTLVAFQRDKNYQMVFPVNNPGTEAGGLWPIRVNRTGAALTIRYMVTGDYYKEGNEEATATAFQVTTGFPMSSVYSEQAYIGNFPSAFDTETETVIDPSVSENRCDLLIYDTNKKVAEMTKIQFKYAESSQDITGMGLATTEVPFVYPMIFSLANSFHITVGVNNSNGKDVKMNFQVSSSEGQYSLTANTNTIFYLKMTAKELADFYQQALNANKTRSNGIATFELPSSALEVVQSAN